MGGSGSGRWGSRRPLVDAFQRIDLADIRREHAVPPEAEAVLIGYRRNGALENTRVDLTTTGTRFGGRRFWFRCPACFGRCRVLFMRSPRIRIACWRCQRLRYRTQVRIQGCPSITGDAKDCTQIRSQGGRHLAPRKAQAHALVNLLNGSWSATKPTMRGGRALHLDASASCANLVRHPDPLLIPYDFSIKGCVRDSHRTI